MNNTIVLLNVKTDRIVHPLSLLYVGSALKGTGFDIKIYNIPYDLENIDATISEILSFSPLFVGFSVFSGLRTAVAARFSQKLKKQSPDTTIVWGGVHPSLVPQQCLQEDFVDIVVIGEGEETAVELAYALKDKSGLRKVKGIGFKQEKEILLTEQRMQISNLDNYKLDWSLINIDECMERLPDGTRYMEYMSSRGCPFNCGFCYNRIFNKRRWRAHSFEHVTEEIMLLKEISGINGILFFDDNFMVDMPRAFKILKFLKDNGIKCVQVETRLDQMNKKILDTVEQLDIGRVFVGWETGSNRILKLINKRLTREQIIEKFKLFSRYPQMAVSASAIVGFPTETWDEICQTIDVGIKISELVPSNIITFQTFLPYPGTDLYDLAIKEGLNPPKRSLDWEGYNTFYGKMKLEWLRWATKKTPQILYRIDKYGKLLNRGQSTSFIRTLGKNILYFLAKFRLKHRFFFFPFEIFILHRFNRYYTDFEGKPIRR